MAASRDKSPRRLICDPIAAQSLSGLIFGRRVAQALLPAALTLPSAQASEARPGRAERGASPIVGTRHARVRAPRGHGHTSVQTGASRWPR